jgi:alpha-tubulin suppressor-like RCC1 family protein
VADTTPARRGATTHELPTHHLPSAGCGRPGHRARRGAVDTGRRRRPAAPANLGRGRAGHIDAGAAHTCAILQTGGVRCWGLGTNGRLGYGNTTDIGDNETPGSITPVDLGAGRTATAITAGDEHTCAILDNGNVLCWGEGSFGRLGYGNTTDIGDNELPGSIAPVVLGAGRTATAITAGGEHTCAILDNAKVRCWGWAFEGRLGYANANDIGDNETPGSVGPVNFGAGRTVTAIAAGDDHNCARLDDGSTRCWGDGADGQLGYANINDIGDNETPGTAGPVDLGAGRTVTDIAAGNDYSCATSTTCRCPAGASGARAGSATRTSGRSATTRHRRRLAQSTSAPSTPRRSPSASTTPAPRW